MRYAKKNYIYICTKPNGEIRKDRNQKTHKRYMKKNKIPRTYLPSIECRSTQNPSSQSMSAAQRTLGDSA